MDPSINIVLQYANVPNPGRMAEFDECIRLNLANPHVESLHNILEPGVTVPDEFRNHPKYREKPHHRWMTYQDAFEYAGAELAGKCVCVCNLDIFLDPSGTDWSQAAALVQREPIVFCLSRFEFNPENKSAFVDPGFQRLGSANTQDAWIFKAPFVVPNSDFEIGTLGCDNAIAHRIKLAGRVPVNMASRFKIFHYDHCRKKTHANQFEVHTKDRATRGLKVSQYPEKLGQYLVPDFDVIRSVDAVLNAVNANEFQRYMVICDVMSNLIKIKNDPND